MFTTGSLGDYLGMPTRKSHYVSSTNVASTIDSCSTTSPISLINSSYSWDSIVSGLSFNATLLTIPGLSCSASYDDSSTVLAKFHSPIKVQRYTNANMRFDILNDINRDYVSHGLLVGITPGDTVLHTWEFDIPISSKDSTVPIRISLGNMINVFDNQGPDQDGISFFILLPSSIMPDSSTLPVSAVAVYDTPQDSEISYSDFPFKSQKSGTNTYPRLLAYRFRAYESVYNACIVTGKHNHD